MGARSENECLRHASENTGSRPETAPTLTPRQSCRLDGRRFFRVRSESVLSARARRWLHLSSQSGQGSRRTLQGSSFRQSSGEPHTFGLHTFDDHTFQIMLSKIGCVDSPSETPVQTSPARTEPVSPWPTTAGNLSPRRDTTACAEPPLHR